jgi:hypothetical protein
MSLSAPSRVVGSRLAKLPWCWWLLPSLASVTPGHEAPRKQEEEATDRTWQQVLAVPRTLPPLPPGKGSNHQQHQPANPPPPVSAARPLPRGARVPSRVYN